jgi:hypothetical protein
MTRKKKFFNHFVKVGVALITRLILTPAISSAVDPVDSSSQALRLKGGKEVLHSALKMARSKPSLALAATITCLACPPVAGVASSQELFMACGVLIAKTLG